MKYILNRYNLKHALAPYVHGKQPINFNVTGKLDSVILMQGFNIDGEASLGDVKSKIDLDGLESIDFTQMKQISTGVSDAG